MMKKLLLISILLPLSLQAKPLSSFESIKNAVLEGKSISTTLDFSRCYPAMPVHTFYKPDSIAITKEHLAFSNNHLTTNDPRFPKQVILENITYHISKLGSYTMTVRYLDPKTYQKLTEEETSVVCELGDSAKVFTAD